MKVYDAKGRELGIGDTVQRLFPDGQTGMEGIVRRLHRRQVAVVFVPERLDPALFSTRRKGLRARQCPYLIHLESQGERSDG